jgi:NADPH:quinone reductase-like Zn-dependent oxidoreductase
MPTIAKGSKVLVSGANGYIAMWVARILLERGYSVRGTARSADKGKFMSDYFASLGYGDHFEAIVVEDIVKVGFFCSVLGRSFYVFYRKEHSMKQSKEWTRLSIRHPLSIPI